MYPRETGRSIDPRIKLTVKLSEFVTENPFIAGGIFLLSDRNRDEVGKKYSFRIDRASKHKEGSGKDSPEWIKASTDLIMLHKQKAHAELLCDMMSSDKPEEKKQARELIAGDPKESFIKMEEILIK